MSPPREDLTGSAAKGGDWDLEFSTGAIESSALVSNQEQASYDGVLQAVAIGTETRANTTTTNSQTTDANTPRSVAVAPDGSFIVVWSGQGPAPKTSGVFFQRYNAAGATAGVETRVNTTTAGAQQSASIAMDASGNFIVVWSGQGSVASGENGGDAPGVFFQRYTAAGATVGAETRVNTTTADAQ